MKTMTLTPLAVAMLLGACGGSGGGTTPTPTPTPLPNPAVQADGVMRAAGGTVSGTSDGTAFTLPGNGASFNGQPGWVGQDLLVNGYESATVLAIGGFQGDGPISAITGDTVAAPAGDATFEGRFTAAGDGFSTNSPATIEFDLSNNSLSITDADFSVAGTVAADGSATGTVTYGTETADFTGGFYGTNEVAAAYNNDAIGGVFFGTN